MDNSAELLATAYHEAGHAVTAWKHGIKIRSATIIPDQDTLGLVLTAGLNKDVFHALENGSPTPTQRDRIERQIIVLLAGRIAEERFTGEEASEGTDGDRAHIADLALALCDSTEEASAYIEWLFVRAKGCVNTLWSSIEQVAAALVRQKTLSSENIAAAILKEVRS